jgi:hypothetical protein
LEQRRPSVRSHSSSATRRALRVVDSVHEGFFINTNKSGTFQQYAIIDADLAAKVRSDT